MTNLERANTTSCKIRTFLYMANNVNISKTMHSFCTSVRVYLLKPAANTIN